MLLKGQEDLQGRWVGSELGLPPKVFNIRKFSIASMGYVCGVMVRARFKFGVRIRG